MSSVCSTGLIVDDLLAMFNGEMGSKMDTASRGIQHTRMQYVSTYVGTHVGMSL